METINTIHVGSRKYLLPNDILFLESDINYTIINLRDGKKIITSTTLKKIEMRLLSFKNFFRVNKSAIVNLDYIYPESNLIQLPDRRVLTFSRRRSKQWKLQQFTAA